MAKTTVYDSLNIQVTDARANQKPILTSEEFIGTVRALLVQAGTHFGDPVLFRDNLIRIASTSARYISDAHLKFKDNKGQSVEDIKSIEPTVTAYLLSYRKSNNKLIGGAAEAYGLAHLALAVYERDYIGTRQDVNTTGGIRDGNRVLSLVTSVVRSIEDLKLMDAKASK